MTHFPYFCRMNNVLELSADTIADLPAVAGKILEWIGEERMICFYGEMGAGKTTLIKAMCSELGVKDSTSSPTFSLVNEYRDKNNQPVYHFDFYRIENEQEALSIGVFEYFDSGHLCLIEWPEKIYNLLPPQFVKVEIDYTPSSSRKITLSR
jgi:tRNA threonylcarbamoyladenosine biosynthesis protein TsaE